MKRITFKSILFFGLMLLSFFVTAQAPDEDTNPDLSCPGPAPGDFANPDRSAPDYLAPVNVGTIDDRTCYSDYSESNAYGKTWGVYNITHNSNHFGGTLQPRMERSLSRSKETGVGSYARFTGTVRILEVGDTSGTNSDGTYIAQAKGKHDTSVNPNGSPDPAICLYLAKPIYTGGVQTSFMIHAERILSRGGEGLNVGREVVPLIEVNKDEEVSFELEVGFAEDPSDPTKKIHYCNAVINGQPFNWNIPEPEIGLESGIRYGAYRVKGGRAQIRWANTAYQKAEVEDTGSPAPSDDIYRLRNVATGEFLTAVGSSAEPVIMTDAGEAQNTHWTFVESGAYFNIDNGTYGILRAPGAGFSKGAYRVVSTGIEGADSSSDKTWTIEYNDVADTYRFESRTPGRYLYQELDGTITHSTVPESDARSVWEAIPTSVSLSTEDNALKNNAVKVYPNPTNGEFTLAFNNLETINIKIYSVLGKLVYENKTNAKKLNIRDKAFTSGIYLIQATTNDNKIYHTKLVVR